MPPLVAEVVVCVCVGVVVVLGQNASFGPILRLHSHRGCPRGKKTKREPIFLTSSKGEEGVTS